MARHQKKLKFGFSGESKAIQKVSQELQNGFYLFSAILGTTFLSVGSGYVGALKFTEEFSKQVCLYDKILLIVFNSYSAFIVGVSFLWIGSFGAYHDNLNLVKMNEELTKKGNEYDDLRNLHDAAIEDVISLRSDIQRLHSNLVETWMKGVFKELDLTSRCRMTAYFENNRDFILLARYSTNPEYKLVHTQKFPLNQGVISKAWQHGEHIDKDSPCFDDNREEYYQYMIKTYGYDKARLDKLTMRSCGYFAKAIIDADITVGVILIEADVHGLLDEERIIKARQFFDMYQSYMSGFVREAKLYDQSIGTQKYISNVDEEMILAVERGGGYGEPQ
jgi:hypothetical protein